MFSKLAQSKTDPSLDQQSLQTFHLYPSLPLEVRLNIWSVYMAEPRLVCVKYFSLYSLPCERVPSSIDVTPFQRQHEYNERLGENGYIGPFPRYGFKSLTPPPPALFTCRDSLVGTKGYDRILGTRYASPETWFHFDSDTLCLNEGWTAGFSRSGYNLQFISADDRRRVKKLILPIHLFGGRLATRTPKYVPTFINIVLKPFANLEQLSLVEWGEGVEEQGDVSLANSKSYHNMKRYRNFIVEGGKEPARSDLFWDQLDEIHGPYVELDEYVTNTKKLQSWREWQVKFGFSPFYNIPKIETDKKLVRKEEKIECERIMARFEENHGCSILEWRARMKS